ncbi:hypothetical protein ACFL1R_10740 [Candidatus Latescibacterota bacterium]
MKDPDGVLKEKPGSVVFAHYAEELARKGEIDKALDVLDKGISANPYYAPGHSVLANVYFMQEMNDKAAKELETALQLDPQTPCDLIRLGEYYLEKEKKDEAARYLWAAHRFEPHVAEIKEALERSQKPPEEPMDLDLSEESMTALSQISGEEELEGEKQDVTTDEEVEDVLTGKAGEEMSETADESFSELIEETVESLETEVEEEEGFTGEAQEETIEEETAETSEDISTFEIGDEETAEPSTVTEDQSEEAASPPDELSSLEPEADMSSDVITEEEPAYDYLLGEAASEETVESLETEVEEDEGIAGEAQEDAIEEETAESTEDISTFEIGDEETAEPLTVTEDQAEEAVSASDELSSLEPEVEVSSDVIMEEVPAYGDLLEEAPSEDTIEEETAESTEASEVPEDTKEDIDLSSLLDEPHEEITSEPAEEEEQDETIEISGAAITEALPTYSEILEEESSGDTSDVKYSESTDEGNILEIDEVGEYDLSGVDIKSSESESVGEEPVLDEEEREELLGYKEFPGAPPVEEAGEPETEIGEKPDETTVPGIPEQPEETVSDLEQGGLYSELSKDEIEALSVSGLESGEQDRELEIETTEGIDYTDILSDQITAPVSEESSDIEEALKESEDDSSVSDIKLEDIIPAELDVESLDESKDTLQKDIPDDAEDVVFQESPEPETPVFEIPDESLSFVEDIIKSAPDIDFLSEEKESVETDSSLNVLIDDYISTIKEDLDKPQSGEPINQQTDANEVAAEDFQEDDSVKDVTATMAEIYASQGMSSRAIKIYTALLEKEPDNEVYKSRLNELIDMQDQKTDES